MLDDKRMVTAEFSADDFYPRRGESQTACKNRLQRMREQRNNSMSEEEKNEVNELMNGLDMTAI